MEKSQKVWKQSDLNITVMQRKLESRGENRDKADKM